MTAMVTHIDTGLPDIGQPFSWAVRGGGVIFTAHGPVDAQGQIVSGDIVQQARLTFENLKRTAAAAGVDLQAVAQVLIYMKDAAHMPLIDAVYREYFDAPYPNRSSVAVAGFAHPGMLIEIVAYLAAEPPPA
jgi:2-iminobutanoate/2-iminopropanoate deaminase